MKAKILVMILCLMISCIPCYSMAEDMSFEGEWLAYVPMWSVYNTNRINMGNEYDITMEEFYSYALGEITDNQIVTDEFSLGDASISVNEPYSIFLGKIKTKFFQKIYDNLYGDGEKGDRITGAKAWLLSNDIILYELMMEYENEYDYYRKWMCFFRCPGDSGEGIEGRWLISLPGAIYSLNGDGTGISDGLFEYEITYTYNAGKNELTIAFSQEEKVPYSVISPNCLLCEIEENGYTLSNYLLKTR